MQLVDVFQSVRRHWRVSLSILVLTGACLGLFLFTRNEVRDPDRWRGGVQLLVPARGKDGVLPEGVPPGLLQGQGVVALSEATRSDALRRAGLEGAGDDVTFAFDSNERGDILILSATAPTFGQALTLSDTFAAAYTAQRRDSVAGGEDGARREARASLEVLQSRLERVDEDLRATDPEVFSLATADDAPAGGDAAPPPIAIPDGTSLDVVLLAYEHRYLVDRIEATQREYAVTAIDALLPGPFSTVVERQVPVQITPGLPSPLVPIAVAVVSGLLLAVLVPVVMDRLDHTIHDPRVAATALSAPVLSTIPTSSPANLATLAAPGSARDSAYRRLAAASIATDELPRAIVVTSPVGRMQDSVAANFAAALAGLGLRVALVATEPSQSWYADSDEQDGALTFPDFLATAHAGRLNGHLRDGMMSTPFENLRVIPHGEAGADELLDGLPPLLHAMAEADIDVTVIAAAAMLEESNATILAWSTRSVLWVVESGEVTEHEAREAAERLAMAGASPFGIAVVSGAG